MRDLKLTTKGKAENVEAKPLGVVDLPESGDDEEHALKFEFRSKKLASSTTSTLVSSTSTDSSAQLDSKENDAFDAPELEADSPFDGKRGQGGASTAPLKESTTNTVDDVVGSAKGRGRKKGRSPQDENRRGHSDRSSFERNSSHIQSSSHDSATSTSSKSTNALQPELGETYVGSYIETFTMKQAKQQLNARLGIIQDEVTNAFVKSQLTSLMQQGDREDENQTSVGDFAQIKGVPSHDVALTLDINVMTESKGAKDRESVNLTRLVALDGSEKPILLKCGDYNPAISSVWKRADELDHTLVAEKDPESTNGLSMASPSDLNRKSHPSEGTVKKPDASSSGETMSTHPAAPLQPHRKRPGRPPKGTSAPKDPTEAPVAPGVMIHGAKRAFPPDSSAAQQRTIVAREPKRKKSECSLCRTCPCQQPAEPTAIPTICFTQSDASIEKALMRRLQKLEQSSDRYEEQAETVRRKLKKHRREMWKKLDAGEDNPLKHPGEYRFLPDSEEMDGNSSALPVSNRPDLAAVDKARRTMFSFASTYQPTLTQMFGCTSKPKLTRGYRDGGNFGLHPGEEETHEKSTEEQCSLEGDDSDYHSENPFPPSDVHRVEIRNGFDTTVESSRIWGPYSSSGGCKPLWDRMFDDPTEMEDLHLEQLETMLDELDSPDSTQTENSPVRLSMLTQRGRHLADEMLVRINSEPDRLAQLDSICPNWQENVLFALHQDDANDVQEAIDGVADAQFKLRRLKEAMLKKIEAQEETLSVFHEALTQSLTRLDVGSSTHLPVSTNSEHSCKQGVYLASASPTVNTTHGHECTQGGR
jgi:hypothetical protein